MIMTEERLIAALRAFLAESDERRNRYGDSGCQCYCDPEGDIANAISKIVELLEDDHIRLLGLP